MPEKYSVLAYIAGPYRAESTYGVVQNIRRAEALMVELIKLGYSVICPHRNTALLDGIIPDNDWIRFDLTMLKRCDILFLLPGWKNSAGSRQEQLCAFENEILTVDLEATNYTIPTSEKVAEFLRIT